MRSKITIFCRTSIKSYLYRLKVCRVVPNHGKFCAHVRQRCRSEGCAELFLIAGLRLIGVTTKCLSVDDFTIVYEGSTVHSIIEGLEGSHLVTLCLVPRQSERICESLGYDCSFSAHIVKPYLQIIFDILVGTDKLCVAVGIGDGALEIVIFKCRAMHCLS